MKRKKQLTLMEILNQPVQVLMQSIPVDYNLLMQSMACNKRVVLKLVIVNLNYKTKLKMQKL